MAVAPDDVWRVQTAYPRIYLACHTRHERRRTSATRLSPSDATVLVHLDRPRPFTPSALAAHLGRGRPAVSASLKRLVALDYVHRRPRAGDARVADLVLTASGRSAVRASSVLDAARVARVLAQLPPADRRRAIDGLSLLAEAADRTRASKEARS